MKYTLMISLLAPTLLAGCELEKKEDPPFKGQHITAAYDTGVVCRQLQQEWQQDDIASQLSCHYLTVPLDYDKEWVDVKQTKWEKRPAPTTATSFLSGNTTRFSSPSWSDSTTRFSTPSWSNGIDLGQVKQETRKVKGDSIDLFYVHYRATGDYRGTLFFNPGGPDSATPRMGPLLTALRNADPDILRHYDIVTMDPRGAGYSALGHELRSCLLKDKNGVKPDMTPSELARLFIERDKGALPALNNSGDHGKALSKLIQERCDEPFRRYAPHLGSQAIVQDMDRLRQHLGHDKITPLTFSYGTRLAALYAQRYPSHVADVIVDSSMSPSEDRYPAIFREDAANAGRVFNWRFGAQALQRSVEVTRQVRDKGQYVDNQGNTLDHKQWEAVMGDALTGQEGYDQLAFWLQDDASELLARLAKEQEGNNPYEEIMGGPFFSAIHCTDNGQSYRWQDLDPEDASFQGAGTFMLDNSFHACADWPYPRKPVPTVDAGEIALPAGSLALVLGAEYDPITPFSNTRQMQAAFGQAARLVRVEQSNFHVQLGSVQCANQALSTLLLGDRQTLMREQSCKAD